MRDRQWHLAQLTSPGGFELIREGAVGEGYGIGDVGPDTNYYDYASGDSGNWQPPVASGSALPLSTKRTTSDGIYTLTQVFNRNTIESAVKITMTLKNNTAASRNFVLLRYADIDANNAHGGDFQNWFDNDDQFVWAHNNGFNFFGVMLSSVPTATPHVTAVQDVTFALTLVSPTGSPRQCLSDRSRWGLHLRGSLAGEPRRAMQIRLLFALRHLSSSEQNFLQSRATVLFGVQTTRRRIPRGLL